MNCTRTVVVGLWAAVVALGALATSTPAEEAATPQAEAVRIGMVSSLFREVPRPMLGVVMQPFAALMKQQTGLSGQIVTAGEASTLGEQLAEDKVQLGVFHGIEFAWARLQHPDLQPLMIAVNRSRHLRAHLVIRSDSEAKSLTDLEGKNLAMPRGNREHCRIFLDQHCREIGRDARQFFAEIAVPSNPEDALDRVFDDEVQATVVDGLALESFQRLKPGRFKQLKSLVESEVFPAGVVVYHKGAIDEATLNRFREGMVSANKTAMGRQMMMLWKLTAFEPIPDDYEATLANIVKFYPPPVALQK